MTDHNEHVRLNQLLQEAVNKLMTPLDSYEQRVSWVYGQLKPGSAVTRAEIEARLLEMGYAKPDALSPIPTAHGLVNLRKRVYGMWD